MVCYGFISLHLLEHIILVSRRFLLRKVFTVGSLFTVFSSIGIPKTFYKGLISLYPPTGNTQYLTRGPIELFPFIGVSKSFELFKTL